MQFPFPSLPCIMAIPYPKSFELSTLLWTKPCAISKRNTTGASQTVTEIPRNAARFTECESYFRETPSRVATSVTSYRKRCSTDSSFISAQRRSDIALPRPRRSESVTKQSSEPGLNKRWVFVEQVLTNPQLCVGIVSYRGFFLKTRRECPV